MAIPLFRSNYRLDRLISHAKVGEMGGVPDYGDYTVRQRVDATDPGELILDWYAYNFTTGETSNYLTMEKDEAILAYTKPNGGWPVAGVIPLGQKIQIKNVNTSIVAFFITVAPITRPHSRLTEMLNGLALLGPHKPFGRWLYGLLTMWESSSTIILIVATSASAMSSAST